MSRTPDFIVVGPPKTATTWMFECLASHPQIYIPKIKQCHYFDKNYDKGLNWYGKMFDDAPSEGVICGDITPDYFSIDEIPKRVRDTCSTGIKIIIIHRDPIKRSYSEYQMKKRSGKVEGTFSEAIDQDQRIISNSLYWKNISAYRQYFCDENIHVVNYDLISRSPDLALKSLYRFLNIDPHIPRSMEQRVNAGGTVSRFQKIFRIGIKVRKKIEKTPMGLSLIRSLRGAGVFNIWHKLVLSKASSGAAVQSEFQKNYRLYLQDDDLEMQKYISHHEGFWPCEPIPEA